MAAKLMALQEFLAKTKLAPYSMTTIDQVIAGIPAGTFDGMTEFESINYMEALCETKAGTVKLNRRR